MGSSVAGIHSGHRARLIRRAQEEGLENFEPHQVLELLLFFAIPRRDTGELAHTLINTFGSVKGVLSASRAELRQVKGIGEQTADMLVRIGECVWAYGALQAEDRTRIGSCAEAMGFVRTHLPERDSEQVRLLCLSSGGDIRLFAKVTDGTAWAESDVLRECLRQMASVRAGALVVVVYTDYGRIEEYDVHAAEMYSRTLQAMECELLDVVFCTASGITSMRKSGEYFGAITGNTRSNLAEQYLRED